MNSASSLIGTSRNKQHHNHLNTRYDTNRIVSGILNKGEFMKTYKFDRFIFKANSINDAINIVKAIESKVLKLTDERLSPMTYKKLKELGVTQNQWKNWTQEQASAFIKNKTQGQNSNKENKKTKKFSQQEAKTDDPRQYLKEATEYVNKKLSSSKWYWPVTPPSDKPLPRERDMSEEDQDKLESIVSTIYPDYDGDIFNGIEGGIRTLSKIAYIAKKYGFDSSGLERNETHTGKYGLKFFRD